MLGFLAMNNEAEYEAIIVGLRMAVTLEITGLKVRYDRRWWSTKSTESMRLKANEWM